MEIDLDRFLIPIIEIDRRKPKVEYEGLPTICYNCGKAAHLVATCPLSVQRQSNVMRVLMCLTVTMLFWEIVMRIKGKWEVKMLRGY